MYRFLMPLCVDSTDDPTTASILAFIKMNHPGPGHPGPHNRRHLNYGLTTVGHVRSYATMMSYKVQGLDFNRLTRRIAQDRRASTDAVASFHPHQSVFIGPVLIWVKE